MWVSPKAKPNWVQAPRNTQTPGPLKRSFGRRSGTGPAAPLVREGMPKQNLESKIGRALHVQKERLRYLKQHTAAKWLDQLSSKSESAQNAALGCLKLKAGRPAYRRQSGQTAFFWVTGSKVSALPTRPPRPTGFSQQARTQIVYLASDSAKWHSIIYLASYPIGPATLSSRTFHGYFTYLNLCPPTKNIMCLILLGIY